MTVRVFFHEQAPAPESDPGRVVPVSRTVPRSPKVATAALNELRRGAHHPRTGGRLLVVLLRRHGGMLRGVRVTGGTGFADFRDFRRLLPNATSSYGSTALLAELDDTLKQFPTIKGTSYAFNGDVPAFYSWLQLVPRRCRRPPGARSRRPPSPAVTARPRCGPAASCWSGAGTVAADPRVFTRCATAPPMTPPATAGSPSPNAPPASRAPR
jgi:hypothetical protein